MATIISFCLKYVLPAAIVALLLGWQIAKLDGELASARNSLAAEIQCLKGSTCASRVGEEAAAGAAAVASAQEAAKTEADAEIAAIQERATDALRQLDAAQAAARSLDIAWQAKFDALKSASKPCSDWAQEVVSCAVP